MRKSGSIAIAGGVLLLSALGLAGVAWGDDEMDIVLSGTESYGSGASVSDDLYSPGGVPNVGLFIGQPNDQTRNDRVLLKYNVEPLLLQVGRVKKAELRFNIDYYANREPKQEVEVEHLPDSSGELTGKDLNRKGVDSVGVVELTAEDATYNSSGSPQPPVEKTIDVTEAVRDDLAHGNTASVFRLKAPLIEAKPNTLPSQGLILSLDPIKRLVLHVTLAD